jgi:hypothetical protein
MILANVGKSTGRAYSGGQTKVTVIPNSDHGSPQSVIIMIAADLARHHTVPKDEQMTQEFTSSLVICAMI